jgi:hypothetical protein
MLGFKAPLAYTSSFYFICRKDGMERKYMMYEGEEVNTIDLISENTTDQRNGVKVIVPVKSYDRTSFKTKIPEQLAYFEDVYFNVEDMNNANVQIVRSQLYQFSSLCKDNLLHVCLDNVYYPLDFQKLGINRIDFPVGLRFGLSDGIFPTPNRESLRYTKETVDKILERIKQLADHMIEKYNTSIEETDDIQNIINYFSYSNRCVLINNRKLDVVQLQLFASISIKSPKLKGIQHLNLEKVFYHSKDYILNEYECKYGIAHGRFREYKRYWDTQIKIKDVDDKMFLFKEKLSGKKKEYLKHLYGSNSGYGNYKKFIKKTSSFRLGFDKRHLVDYHSYYSLLGLKHIPRENWRAAIIEFKGIIDGIISKLKCVDDIEIDKTWEDSRKSPKQISVEGDGVRKRKLQGEIVCKIGQSLERWVDGKNCKWVSTTLKLNELEKASHLTIYSDSSDKNVEMLDAIFKIVKGTRNKIKVATLSDRELKNIEKLDLHNWIKLDKFMEGNNKPFKRLVTAYKINQLRTENSETFRKIGFLVDVCTDLHDKISELNSYADEYYANSSKEIYDAMLAVADEHKLYDYKIYHTYENVKNLLEKLTFVQKLMVHVSSWRTDDQLKSVFIDLFKYNKHRINWSQYNIKLNEEQPILEPEEISA